VAALRRPRDGKGVRRWPAAAMAQQD